MTQYKELETRLDLVQIWIDDFILGTTSIHKGLVLYVESIHSDSFGLWVARCGEIVGTENKQYYRIVTGVDNNVHYISPRNLATTTPRGRGQSNSVDIGTSILQSDTLDWFFEARDA